MSVSAYWNKERAGTWKLMLETGQDSDLLDFQNEASKHEM